MSCDPPWDPLGFGGGVAQGDAPGPASSGDLTKAMGAMAEYVQASREQMDKEKKTDHLSFTLQALGPAVASQSGRGRGCGARRSGSGRSGSAPSQARPSRRRRPCFVSKSSRRRHRRSARRTSAAWRARHRPRQPRAGVIWGAPRVKTCNCISSRRGAGCQIWTWRCAMPRFSCARGGGTRPRGFPRSCPGARQKAAPKRSRRPSGLP